MLKLTNTLSRKKESFEPIKKNIADLYVCGITPYDYAHLGHGRCYTAFDLLVRVLKFLNYDVHYCRNFTDIDDKILKRALIEFGDINRYPEITTKYINAFNEDVKSLNCLDPTFEPRVTQMIPHIISFIEKLIQKGHAYASDGDVYFSVDSFDQYGKLSKQKKDDLISGQRVEQNDRKRSPLDFALWKKTDDGTFWKSPWGYGRPGWHIECSVMAEQYLGKEFDIHGGGRDLIFPHHENEIAQSESLHDLPMARIWMHNGFVQINKEKMSKSLGNFFTLRDIFKQFDPMVIRYYFLSHHYGAPLDFSFDDVTAVQKSYKRLTRVFDALCSQDISHQDMLTSPTVQKMLVFLYDDLNTPGMLGVLFEHLDRLQKDKDELCVVKFFLQQVLGLTLEPLPEKKVTITPEIQQLIDERVQARADKDWAKADQLRDKLIELGVDLKDKKI
ncbi:MAG: cysteine--tRNA ligase [Candidatus Dependentiae bacterium]